MRVFGKKEEKTLNVNEPEVFALLVHCRELRRLRGYNAIIEGDSFSAIQWGLGNLSYPWHLVDWMEEVQDILRHLGVLFFIMS